MYDEMQKSQLNKKKLKKRLKNNSKKNLIDSSNGLYIYMQKKLVFLFFTIILALFALSFKLTGIVTNSGERYKQIIFEQQDTSGRTIPFKRGDILDRNEIFLATSEKVYNLILEPKIINESGSTHRYKEATIKALIDVFGYERDRIETVLLERENSFYYRFDRQVSHEKVTEFKEYVRELNASNARGDNGDDQRRERIAGVNFEDEYKRVYPQNQVASHVLGYSSKDGTVAEWGGIEQQYNSELVGTNGKETGYINNAGMLERIRKESVDGNTIITTIDINIQRILEKHSNGFMQEPGAENVGIIVMDPNNGEILGMASNHSFDLNNPRDLSLYYTPEQLEVMSDEEKSNALQQSWRNFTISDAFEPGSTTKIFTVAAALEEGIVRQNETFVCDGHQQVGGFTIKCTKQHGTITLEEALMYSCNDALMQIGARMGSEILSKYKRSMGLGSKTNIDIPGEVTGILYDAKDMGSSTLATNAFGQNFTTTMIQVAAGYASIINGGTYYEPHIVRKIVNSNGSVVKTIEPNAVRETVGKSTSEFIKKALFETIEAGTGTRVWLEGYKIAGKTGTAEKLPRSANNYLLSLCGFVPYDNPKIILYVVVDQPHGTTDQSRSGYSSILFKAVMEDLLEYIDVFPERTGNEILEPDVTNEAPEETENTQTGETLVEVQDEVSEESDESSEGIGSPEALPVQ